MIGCREIKIELAPVARRTLQTDALGAFFRLDCTKYAQVSEPGLSRSTTRSPSPGPENHQKPLGKLSSIRTRPGKLTACQSSKILHNNLALNELSHFLVTTNRRMHSHLASLSHKKTSNMRVASSHVHVPAGCLCACVDFLATRRPYDFCERTSSFYA